MTSLSSLVETTAQEARRLIPLDPLRWKAEIAVIQSVVLDEAWKAIDDGNNERAAALQWCFGLLAEAKES